MFFIITIYRKSGLLKMENPFERIEMNNGIYSQHSVLYCEFMLHTNTAGLQFYKTSVPAVIDLKSISQ